MRIALFPTCFDDTLLPGTGRAVVDVLERLGHTVDLPLARTCCGQMHFTTGYRPDAVPLVRRFADTFTGYEAVVTLSASCVGMVRDHHPDLAARYAPAELQEKVARLVPRIHEFTEFLTDALGVVDVGAVFPHRVTYHPTCHSPGGLRPGERPLRLLRAVRGIELVDLPASDSCCGFGGSSALEDAAASPARLADRMRGFLDTGAEVVCAADNSCLTHIGGGLARLDSGVRALHLAEILAGAEGGPR
ncbi:L-lactate dehydrogenase complex protein LldE [Streptomyces sp. TLI_053]|uniref:(Fe-S)-binding protein n=1 Tax=Streptomyces sp. TLI_053 TaxID=1855352 RepID=UPI00087AB117|nr:(Fe-S)-binding protein [Streptomyces sp. TLI_053]SDT08063.1 L-lactate dehydrogenase complex protein LldE [Streptomyces sp. TLI_053]